MTNGNACLASDANEWAMSTSSGGVACANPGTSETPIANARVAHVGWRTVWPVVSGMPNRAAGCRLVGNAIVPVIAYAIFAAIAAVEARAAAVEDAA